jgi:hypothetical protein
MAPEQAEGEAADEAADTYSLALTLYELWAGANPVARATPAHTARQIGEPVPPLRELRPDLPEPLTTCVDACLGPDPRSRPLLSELQDRLEAAAPALDGERPVPSPGDATAPGERATWLRAGQLVALTGWGLAMTSIAAVWGRPGLALMLGALTAPAILVASRLAWAGVPVVAALLGAVSAAPVYAAVAGSRGTLRERAVLGALGWWWLLAGAATSGLGAAPGVASHAPDGWTESTAGAAALLSSLLEPQALLGAGAFALAAVALGLVLRAGHLAVALLWALLWAAGLEGAMGLVGNGGLAGRPVLIAAAATTAVILEFRRRSPRPEGRRAPIPHARPAIQA